MTEHGQAAAPDEVESLPSFGRPVGRRRLIRAAVPDGPRTWQLPVVGDCWRCDRIAEDALLTDATPADGQDGDDHG